MKYKMACRCLNILYKFPRLYFRYTDVVLFAAAKDCTIDEMKNLVQHRLLGGHL